MQSTQLYSTSLLSDTTEHSFHVLVIPGKVLPERLNFKMVATALGFDRENIRTNATRLAFHLAVLVAPGLTREWRWQAMKYVSRGLWPLRECQKADRRFAELVAFQRIIPIEHHPLTKESLATLAVMPKDQADSKTWIRFVIYQSYPLLCALLPAGLIIGGSGHDAARALGKEGLQDHAIAWLKSIQPPPSLTVTPSDES